ncbi:hypothetical protein CAPTEDRAFT_193112 [Capitella teleta]|uniref:Uncharacterized protein n=1 Tax=Capitella teleta TaxID=283909 RepID=R7UNQ9_CAPTE|nr:hypothetical protein CAPTEDRAFT_193112 [Capitella teleta]|eukprot:ELU07743.1 hypothetical protein CAPTEDRAFT_193112 [Capitella teleta]
MSYHRLIDLVEPQLYHPVSLDRNPAPKPRRCFDRYGAYGPKVKITTYTHIAFQSSSPVYTLRLRELLPKQRIATVVKKHYTIFHHGRDRHKSRYILLCLAQHGCILSDRHLRRILAKKKLCRRKFFDIDDVASFVNNELKGSGQQFGYRFMWRKLKDNGLNARKDDVRLIIPCLDPEGVVSRMTWIQCSFPGTITSSVRPEDDFQVVDYRSCTNSRLCMELGRIRLTSDRENWRTKRILMRTSIPYDDDMFQLC